MRRLCIAALVALAGLVAGPASARDFAPVDRPGPPLSVPAATLAGAFSCQPGVAASPRAPVLFVPGTTLTPEANFSWNYMRAFAARGMPYCAIELPDAATGDVQLAGEYVAYAIRRAFALGGGRRIQIVGFSQGGMVPRWALRFWPDTRAMVDDLVGLDPSNHGTLSAEYCGTTSPSCPAAFWQQRASAQFIKALNSSQETFAGISYTSIYSRYDEVVTPNFDESGSSALRTGDGRRANLLVQSLCPANASEHLAMGSYDAVGYALALDALAHDGPADPARIGSGVCALPFHEGVNAATFAADLAAYTGAVGAGINRARQLNAEPALACYVFADCPSATRRVASERRAAVKRKARAKKRAKKRAKRRSARARAAPRFTG